MSTAGYTPQFNNNLNLGTSTIGWAPTYAGGFPNMPKFEYLANTTMQGNKQPGFDVVSPWQQLAQQDVTQNYQDTLAKNQAMQGTAARQASEGLAMQGGVRAAQTARLADKAAQNTAIQNQLAGQQQAQNQLQVSLAGEEMGKEQSDYLAKQQLQSDLVSQGVNINTANSLNDYINKMVDDLIKKKMGKDMMGAI